MAAPDRYFVDSPIKGDLVTLAGPESHHLVHVLRAKAGTRVVLFDGSGAEFLAQVDQVGRTEVKLKVLSRHEVSRELSVALTLGVALPKGDRQKWLVEKAVELGVARIVPLWTSRSVAQPVGQALARLQRTVIEASKQCGRNRLLEIGQPQPWADFVATTQAVPWRLLAHPAPKPHPGQGLHRFPLPGSQEPEFAGPILLAVGPEGGFTSEEVALATTTGWQAVDLGQPTLRIETAAIFLVAAVVLALQS
jgi:16S rRNA (uracil1498-N3)-methyltransferase